jgi:hypothetical protein
LGNEEKGAVGSKQLSRNNADIGAEAADKVNHTGAVPKSRLLNNADLETRMARKPEQKAVNPKPVADPGEIDTETYTGLINELMHVREADKRSDHKVNIDGEIRYHYSLNSGPGRWGQDASGIRAYLGFDTAINMDWRAFGMLEAHRNITNYYNDLELSRLYVEGKSGVTQLRAGSFGYLMADGNIYDSGFDGIRADFGGPLKYTVSVGETDSTKETTIATVRYEAFDYSLETGIYHYLPLDGSSDQNTIWTLGGKYNFSNFGVGVTAFGSSRKDSRGEDKGYVFDLNYGDFRTYRPDTYEIFARYYNQPQYTYIAHGMNGPGTRMQGFKGYGLGMSYTLAENVAAGIEYYGLKDKISGDNGKSWWSQLTRYF